MAEKTMTAEDRERYHQWYHMTAEDRERYHQWYHDCRDAIERMHAEDEEAIRNG